jgi:hypothetical protein
VEIYKKAMCRFEKTSYMRSAESTVARVKATLKFVSAVAQWLKTCVFERSYTLPTAIETTLGNDPNSSRIEGAHSMVVGREKVHVTRRSKFKCLFASSL